MIGGLFVGLILTKIRDRIGVMRVTGSDTLVVGLVKNSKVRVGCEDERWYMMVPLDSTGPEPTSEEPKRKYRLSAGQVFVNPSYRESSEAWLVYTDNEICVMLGARHKLAGAASGSMPKPYHLIDHRKKVVDGLDLAIVCSFVGAVIGIVIAGLMFSFSFYPPPP